MFQGIVGLFALAVVAIMVKDVISKNTNGAQVAQSTETNIVDFAKVLSS